MGTGEISPTPPEDVISPLTAKEFEKFVYHLSVATTTFRKMGPPDEFLTEFISLSFRLIQTYEQLMRDRWNCEEHGG